MALLVLLYPVVFGASISLISAPAGTCFEMYPGDSMAKLLIVTVDKDGWYTLNISTTGVLVYPQKKDIYLKADEPWYEVLTIKAPANYAENYYTVYVSLYDANNDLVAAEEYCVHVVLEKPVEVTVKDFTVTAEAYEFNDDYLVVPLVVKNTGDVDLEVTLDADYKYTYFSENPVTVKAGDEEKVYARIPLSDDLPEKITFYAFSAGVRKDVIVRLDLRKAVQLETPETVTLSASVVRTLVTVRNTGTLPVSVKLVGKGLPAGVALLSDKHTIAPGESATFVAMFMTTGTTTAGTYPVQVCAMEEDEEDEALACKYAVLDVPAPEKEVNIVHAAGAETVVEVTVENGPTALNNVTVQVSAPEGWVVKAEPSQLSLAPFEKASVKVYFKPTRDAKPGTAYIYLRSAGGIIATEAVPLEPTATGYAAAGEAPAWAIVLIIILGVVGALFIHKQNTEEKVKREMKKKKVE